MASSASSGSPLATRKENPTPIDSRVAELDESRLELRNRLKSMKEDLQSWRGKLDTQANLYKNQLMDLKKSLNVEVEQLRAGLNELETDLRQQQEDLIKTMGIQNSLEEPNKIQNGTISELPK